MPEPTVRLYKGNCLEVVPTFGPSVFDTIITDPPYELGFMDKNWDKRGVSFDPVTWATMLQAAKPGAFLVCFGGTRTYHRIACAIEDAGWQIRDCLMWLYGQGFPKSLDIGTATEEKAWQGWGTALKPAWEPIILAMKPLEGTYAENALNHGVAGLNVDESRLTTSEILVRVLGKTTESASGWKSAKRSPIAGKNGGRWPANVLLEHDPQCTCVGEVEDDGYVINRFTDGMKPFGEGAGHEYETTKVGGGTRQLWACVPSCPVRMLDMQKGGASRFFYCGKAGVKEKNAGLPDGTENKHPTVKPVGLMEWLCRLTSTPSGGIVLDPFMGSGTTGIGCWLTGRSFVGIDQDEEYCNLANLRISNYPYRKD